MTGEAPSAPTPVAPTTSPGIDLGPGFVALPFAAGKYSVVLARKLHGTHSRQVLNEVSASSLVLDFGPDGVATACRGRRYDHRNSGPKVKTEERYREQQGYRGKHVVRDGVAELTLERDDEVCPPLFEGSLALPRAAKLELRCVLAQATGGLKDASPILLCQSVGAVPAELEPYQVPQLAPKGWLALAGGNGLLIRMTGRPQGARAGADGEVTAQVSEQPLDGTAWNRPL